MKQLAMLLGGCLLASRALSAQTVPPAQLVGTWRAVSVEGGTPEQPRIVEDLLTLRADSTWTTRRRVNGAEDSTRGWRYPSGEIRTGRWTLSRDSLRFLGADDTYSPPAYKVAFQDQHLMLWLGEPQQGKQCDPIVVFNRIDPSNLLPPQLPPITVNRADIVGAWVWYAEADRMADTLTLQPDSTWIEKRGFSDPARRRQNSDVLRKGAKWFLLPGDKLELVYSSPSPRDSARIVALRGRKLKVQDKDHFSLDVGCEEPWMYQRVP